MSLDAKQIFAMSILLLFPVALVLFYIMMVLINLGYDQLTLEERSNLLAKICGVVSASQHHKICTRSTKCPVHSDAQRREVRLRWLSTEEESHVDIDR